MYKEAAVGERIAQWIRTPQVPGSRPGGNSTLSTELPTVYHHDKVYWLCGRSGLTQDNKMGSCVFQCDVPHQWIAQ